MRLVVWRFVNKTLKFRLMFLIMLTINFLLVTVNLKPENISQGELIVNMTMVEVTLEKVYYSKLKFTMVNGAVSVTGIFQFTIVNSTLVNFHDYRGKNKDDPSLITIWLPKKIGGYISSLSKLCLFC